MTRAIKLSFPENGITLQMKTADVNQLSSSKNHNQA